MSLFLEPNLRTADDLLLGAMRARDGERASFATHGDEPGLALKDVLTSAPEAAWVGDDVPVMAPETSHYGTVAKILARLVYLLTIGAEAPKDVCPHCVWVADISHPAISGGRTVYLAVAVDTATPWHPILMPLPDLSPNLLGAADTIAETRQALRSFASGIADLVNLALPAARALAASGLTTSED
jgi:hypothetical protein